MMLSTALRGPFAGLPMREVPPQKDKYLGYRVMQAEGYTSAVVDKQGLIVRLLRHDPNGVNAAIMAERMNTEAAGRILTDGTDAQYVFDEFHQ